MPRAKFTKTGTAIWMSHLDLMRLLQRAFRRGGLLLKHSQGYTPHPALSLALPLSVGVSSSCELMDFELAEGQAVEPEELRRRLNAALPAGVEILRVYDGGRKLKELRYLAVTLTLCYDRAVPAQALPELTALFARPELLVEKKTKSGGVTQQNILEMLRDVRLSPAGDRALQLQAVLCAQYPSLNPAQLLRAIEQELPQYAPAFSRIHRDAMLDQDGHEFT